MPTRRRGGKNATGTMVVDRYENPAYDDPHDSIELSVLCVWLESSRLLTQLCGKPKIEIKGKAAKSKKLPTKPMITKPSRRAA